MSETINGDMAVRAMADTARMQWAPSPSGLVWRKRVHLVGPPESGQVTSVVRYEPAIAASQPTIIPKERRSSCSRACSPTSTATGPPARFSSIRKAFAIPPSRSPAAFCSSS